MTSATASCGLSRISTLGTTPVAFAALVALKAADVEALVDLPTLGAHAPKRAARPRVDDSADEVTRLATGLEEMGAAAFRADLASQRHETQYTRLFRS